MKGIITAAAFALLMSGTALAQDASAPAAAPAAPAAPLTACQPPPAPPAIPDPQRARQGAMERASGEWAAWVEAANAVISCRNQEIRDATADIQRRIEARDRQLNDARAFASGIEAQRAQWEAAVKAYQARFEE